MQDINHDAAARAVVTVRSARWSLDVSQAATSMAYCRI